MAPEAGNECFLARKDQTMGEHIAKIRVSLKDGIIEISGSEDFVSKQLSQSDKLLDIHQKLVQQTLPEKQQVPPGNELSFLIYLNRTKNRPIIHAI